MVKLGSEPGGGGNGGTDPKPSFWQRLGNFFSNLCSGADITTFASGATVTRAVQVGELVPMGEAILTWEEVMAAVGSLRGGVWGLPLILNGDSQFAANSRSFTIPTDIPITTTSEPQQMMTLFRGVHAQHPDFSKCIHGNGYTVGRII